MNQIMKPKMPSPATDTPTAIPPILLAWLLLNVAADVLDGVGLVIVVLGTLFFCVEEWWIEVDFDFFVRVVLAALLVLVGGGRTTDSVRSIRNSSEWRLRKVRSRLTDTLLSLNLVEVV